MDMHTYAVLAKRVDLFRGLVPDDIAKIFARGMTMSVQKGEVIFYKGTVGSQMYIVLGGQVVVMGRKKAIATLNVGDMFGEMALLNNEPRTATVVAPEDSRLFVLSETTFQRLLTKRVAVQLLLNIVRTLSHRLDDANKQLSDMASQILQRPE